MSKEEQKLRAEVDALKAQLAQQSRLVEDSRAEAAKMRTELEAQGQNVLRLSAELSQVKQGAQSQPAGPTVPAVAIVPLKHPDGKPTHYWEAREYQVPVSGGTSVVPKGDTLRHPEARSLAVRHLNEVTAAQGREAGW